MSGGEAVRIVIPVYEGFDLLDVCGPSEMFFWANYQVDLVAEVAGPVRAKNGFVLDVPQAFGDAAPCDAMWVPGGDPGQLDRLIHDPAQTYIDYIRRQADEARWVCSVCEGALLMAAAGLLDGYRATTHWGYIPYLLEYFPADQGGVTVADGHPRFVQDGNRLTGGGISSGLDEALRLIELLSGTAAAQSAQQTTQYYPDPPVTSQIPNVITSNMVPFRPGAAKA